MSRVRKPRDEWSRINDLETRVANLERTNAMALAAIPNPGGGSSDYVLATQLAYGLAGQSVTTLEGTASTVWTDLATVGPAASVEVGPSGRAFVLGVCNAQPEASSAPCRMGVSLDGADPIDQLVASTGGAVLPDNTAAAAILVVTDVLTGLAEGAHTFTMRYLLSGGSGASFQDRTLVVWPF